MGDEAKKPRESGEENRFSRLTGVGALIFQLGVFYPEFLLCLFLFFFFATVCMPCNFYCYFAKLLSIDLRLAQVWSMFSCQFFGRSSFFCSCQSLLFDYKSLSMKIKPKE